MNRLLKYREYESLKYSVYRSFAFTYNNYTPEGIQRVKDMSKAYCLFMIYTPEVGTKGTPHLQGYFIVKPNIMLNRIRKIIPNTIYIKPARESIYRNIKYCTKDANEDNSVYMFVDKTFDWQEYANFDENPWRFLWAESVIANEEGNPFTNEEWDLFNKYQPIGDIVLDGEP